MRDYGRTKRFIEMVQYLRSIVDRELTEAEIASAWAHAETRTIEDVLDMVELERDRLRDEGD